MQTPPGPPPPPPWGPRPPPVPPYYAPPYPNAQYGPAATDGKATASLVLGIMAVVASLCYGIGFVFAVPALILGIMSRKAIARSEGALGGGGLATAGIITSSVGGALAFLQVAAFIGIIVLSATTHAPPPHPPPVYVPTASPAPATPSPPVTSYGAAHIVDLHAAAGPLRAQLGIEYARAAATHEKLMVMTAAAWSKESLDISATFADDEMQDALEDVTVVRIDIDEFKAELRAAKLDKPDVPWFFLLGPSIDPTDAISADEWGANVPHTIAPVLRKFVRGTLTKRRVAPPKGTAL